jgi:DNA topoisomerase IA
MADQIVITEKSSQAKDVRAAVGSRYGNILPAEGHLFDLLEPEDVVPEMVGMLEFAALMPPPEPGPPAVGLERTIRGPNIMGLRVGELRGVQQRPRSML